MPEIFAKIVFDEAHAKQQAEQIQKIIGGVLSNKDASKSAQIFQGPTNEQLARLKDFQKETTQVVKGIQEQTKQEKILLDSTKAFAETQNKVIQGQMKAKEAIKEYSIMAQNAGVNIVNLKNQIKTSGDATGELNKKLKEQEKILKEAANEAANYKNDLGDVNNYIKRLVNADTDLAKVQDNVNRGFITAADAAGKLKANAELLITTKKAELDQMKEEGKTLDEINKRRKEIDEQIKKNIEGARQYEIQQKKVNEALESSQQDAMDLAEGFAKLGANIGSLAGVFGEFGKVPGLVANSVSATMKGIKDLEGKGGLEKALGFANIGLMAAQAAKQVFDAIDGAIRAGEQKIIDKGKAATAQTELINNFKIGNQTFEDRIHVIEEVGKSNAKLASGLRAVSQDTTAFNKLLDEEKKKLQEVRAAGLGMEWKTSLTGGGLLGWLQDTTASLVKWSAEIGKTMVLLDDLRTASAQFDKNLAESTKIYTDSTKSSKQKLLDLEIQIASAKKDTAKVHDLEIQKIKNERDATIELIKEKQRLAEAEKKTAEDRIIALRLQEQTFNNMFTTAMQGGLGFTREAANYFWDVLGVNDKSGKFVIGDRVKIFQSAVQEVVKANQEALRLGKKTAKDLEESVISTILKMTNASADAIKVMQEKDGFGALFRDNDARAYLESIALIKPTLIEADATQKKLQEGFPKFGQQINDIMKDYDTIIAKTKELWKIQEDEAKKSGEKVVKVLKDVETEVNNTVNIFANFTTTINNYIMSINDSFKNLTIGEVIQRLTNINFLIGQVNNQIAYGNKSDATILELGKLLAVKTTLENVLTTLQAINVEKVKESNTIVDNAQKELNALKERNAALAMGTNEKDKAQAVDAKILWYINEINKATDEGTKQYLQKQLLAYQEITTELQKQKEINNQLTEQERQKQALLQQTNDMIAEKNKAQKDARSVIDKEYEAMQKTLMEENNRNLRLKDRAKIYDDILGKFANSNEVANKFLKSMQEAFDKLNQDTFKEIDDWGRRKVEALEALRALGSDATDIDREKTKQLVEYYDKKIQEVLTKEGKKREEIIAEYQKNIEDALKVEEDKLNKMVENFNKRLLDREKQTQDAKLKLNDYVYRQTHTAEENAVRDAVSNYQKEYEEFRKAGVAKEDLAQWQALKQKELTKDFTETQKKAFESQKKTAIETSEAIVKAAEEAWNKETAKQRDEINKQIDLVNQLRQAALDAKNILLELLGQPVDNRQATVTPQLTVPTQTGQTSQGKEPPLSYGAGLHVGGNVTWNGIVWRWNGKGWDYVKSASEGSLPPQTTPKPPNDAVGYAPWMGMNPETTDSRTQGNLIGDIINQVTGITKDGAVQTGIANAFGMLGLGQIAGQSFKDTVKDNLVGKDGKGGLAAEMPGYGKTIVEMLAEGIKNNVNVLRDAVDKLTLEISLQLEPHSPPKEGRLHTIDKWMPKIVQLLAGGSLSDSDIRKPFLILADKIASSLGVGLDFGIIQAARQFKKSYTNNMNPLIASIEGGNANTFYQTSEAGKQQVWDMYNQDQSKVNDFNAFLAALNLRPGGNFSDFEKGGKFADTEMARIFANNKEFDWQNGTDGKIGLGTNMAKGLLESTWFKALTPKLTDEQMLGKYGQFWKQNTPKMNAFTGYDLNSLQTMLPYLNQSDSKNDSFYKILSRIYYNMRELDNPNAKFSNLEQFLGVNLQQGPLDKGVLQYQINSPYAYEKYDLMMNEGAKSQAANEAANQAWRARNGIQMRPAAMDSSYAQGYDDWSRAMTLQGKWSGSDFESYDAYARKNKTYIDNSLNRVARDQAGYYETQKGGDYYNAGVSNDASGNAGTNIIYYVSINIDGDNLDSSGIVDKVFEELDARSMNYSA